MNDSNSLQHNITTLFQVWVIVVTKLIAGAGNVVTSLKRKYKTVTQVLNKAPGWPNVCGRQRWTVKFLSKIFNANIGFFWKDRILCSKMLTHNSYCIPWMHTHEKFVRFPRLLPFWAHRACGEAGSEHLHYRLSLADPTDFLFTACTHEWDEIKAIKIRPFSLLSPDCYSLNMIQYR